MLSSSERLLVPAGIEFREKVWAFRGLQPSAYTVAYSMS
jgi:hypothetical protein